MKYAYEVAGVTLSAFRRCLQAESREVAVIRSYWSFVQSGESRDVS